jgi:hypothetical protein
MSSLLSLLFRRRDTDGILVLQIYMTREGGVVLKVVGFQKARTKLTTQIATHQRLTVGVLCSGTAVAHTPTSTLRSNYLSPKANRSFELECNTSFQGPR